MLLILKKVHLTTAFSRSLIRLLKKTRIVFLLKSKMMKVKILILSQNQAQPKKRVRRVKMRMKTLLNQQLRIKKTSRLIQKKRKKKRSVSRYFNKFYPVQIQIIYQLMKIQPQKIKGLQLKKQQPCKKQQQCNICKIKFTKHGLTRHRNSCQAKAAKKN